MTQFPSFDPRQVAVVGVDHHLPKVLAEALQPEDLVRRFASDHVWAPELLTERSFQNVPLCMPRC